MSEERNMSDPYVKQALETASFGEAAKIFLNSDMGKYIVNKATAEIDEAIADLIDVDPFDSKAVSAAQRRVREAQGALVWFGEAISDGEHALRMLEDPA